VRLPVVAGNIISKHFNVKKIIHIALKQGFLGRTHEICFPLTHTSSHTDLVLMSCLDYVNL
jgi:hypothetical protein